MFAITGLTAQFVNDAGEVKVDEIVAVLKSFEPLSHAQDSMSKAVIQSLLASTRVHPVLMSDLEKKKAVFLTMVDIATPKGKFEFLTNRFKEYREREEVLKNDTIDSEVYALDKKYKALQDSMKSLEMHLLDIMQSPVKTRATKRRASTILGRTNNLAIADFMFKNYTLFMFGDYDPDNSTDCWGCERSGAADFIGDKIYDEDISTVDEYGHKKVILPGIVNWTAFPFFIKYWGNKEYNSKLDKTWSGGLFEFAVFHNMITENYQKPWLLFEFMKANAEDPNSKILRDIGTVIENNRRKFEQQEKNEKQ